MDPFEKEIEAGRAVVLPTETVYGLFAKALDETAVDQVYTLKQRPREKAMNLNISSEAEIRFYSKNQPTLPIQIGCKFFTRPFNHHP